LQLANTIFCGFAGLVHLHDECTPSVVHGDIKPINILLDHNYHTKITNFGLNGTHAGRVLTGTSGYVDPSYFYNVNLGTHYDVYSFGVVLLQLVTGKAASDSLREAAAYYITDWVSCSSFACTLSVDPEMPPHRESLDSTVCDRASKDLLFQALKNSKYMSQVCGIDPSEIVLTTRFPPFKYEGCFSSAYYVGQLDESDSDQNADCTGSFES